MISFANRPWQTAGRTWRSMFQGAGRSSKRWRICLQGDEISIFRWNNFPLFPLNIPKGGISIPYIVGFLVGSWPRFVTTVWSHGFSPLLPSPHWPTAGRAPDRPMGGLGASSPPVLGSVEKDGFWPHRIVVTPRRIFFHVLHTATT